MEMVRRIRDMLAHAWVKSKCQDVGTCDRSLQHRAKEVGPKEILTTKLHSIL
jgi:hypothetical protein